MKKALQRLLTIALFLLVGGVLFPCERIQAADTKAPVIDTSTITVSKKTIGLKETTTISVKITDESKLASTTIWTIGVGTTAENFGGIYNESTGKWEFEVSSNYFGLNEIQNIRAADVYGNITDIYNSHARNFIWPETQNEDLSAGDFTVSIGSYSPETTKPNILWDTLTVDNSKPKLGQTVYYKVKVNDSSPIAYTYIYYAYVSAQLASRGVYNSSTGYYEFQVDCTTYGEYQPLVLIAEDAFGNKAIYADRSQTMYEKYPHSIPNEAIEHSLKAANIKVQGGANDRTPPRLDLSSFQIEKLYLPTGEYTYLSFKAYDESGINVMNSDIWDGGMAGDGAASISEYDKKTGRYRVLVGSDFYGTHQIYEMSLCDVCGNKIFYVDSDSEIFKRQNGFIPEGEYKKVSLAATTYYVGLENRKTGTFVSNSTMDKTSRLNVNELGESGRIFNQLSQNGYNVKGFYEVKVNGKCDMTKEDSKVCFEAPEGFENGDKLRIRHLLSNGTVQTQDAVVRKGKVCIDVKEFSPFMVEVAKNQDKNLFTKKGITYQVISKKAVKVVGVKNKKIKAADIPATVKAFGKKYKVTKIEKEAFMKLKKLKKVTIGKNISKIGSKAFYQCKKLKKLIFKTKKLSKKNVGKEAFKGISKKVKIETPKGKEKTYDKFLKK